MVYIHIVGWCTVRTTSNSLLIYLFIRPIENDSFLRCDIYSAKNLPIFLRNLLSPFPRKSTILLVLPVMLLLFRFTRLSERDKHSFQWLHIYSSQSTSPLILHLKPQRLDRSPNSLCGICGGQSGIWARFSPSNSVLSRQYDSTNSLYAYCIQLNRQ